MTTEVNDWYVPFHDLAVDEKKQAIADERASIKRDLHNLFQGFLANDPVARTTFHKGEAAGFEEVETLKLMVIALCTANAALAQQVAKLFGVQIRIDEDKWERLDDSTRRMLIRDIVDVGIKDGVF